MLTGLPNILLTQKILVALEKCKLTYSILQLRCEIPHFYMKESAYPDIDQNRPLVLTLIPKKEIMHTQIPAAVRIVKDYREFFQE